MRKQLIEQKLLKHKIIYTDIIQYCQRKLGKTKNGKLKYTANDTDLYNIIPNKNVLNFLFNNSTIKRIYFTNSSLFGMGKDFFNKNGQYSLKRNDAFQLFLKTSQQNLIKIEVYIPNSDLGWLSINEDNNMTKERRIFLNNILSTKVLIKIKLTNSDIFKEFDVVSSVSPAATGETRTTSQYNYCVKKFSELNECSIKDSPKKLLKTTIEAFFNGTIESLEQYNVQYC